ncbi:transcription initiation factor TFIID subunit 4-like isoform X2 [Oratosquilla oratoria]|uniref:transcription initiation factor TFIID subunit 4-like isoform X2 n=1 Tax=Oratosquilla oratoria TaxID=337810 RepID=UPI003F769C67
MATSNSLDEVLKTDVDTSAVNALVGSIETPLAASTKTTATQPVNSCVNAGLAFNQTAVVGGVANGGKLGLSGPVVSSGAVVVSKVVSAVTQVAGHSSLSTQGQVVGISPGGYVAQAINNGAKDLKLVYGVGPTPMTGAHGTHVVNGGVSGTAGGVIGTPGAVQGTVQVATGPGGATGKGVIKPGAPTLGVAAAGSVVTVAQTSGTVIMSKPGTVTAVPTSGPHGAVPLAPRMQIVNMRPGQPIPVGPQGAPRMIISPQVVQGIRTGQSGQFTLNALQGLPPGAQGHLLVKTENGQLQLLRVNTAPGQLPAGTPTTAVAPPTTAYRFQQPTGGVVGVRPVVVSSAATGGVRPQTAIMLQSQATNTVALSTTTTSTTTIPQAQQVTSVVPSAAIVTQVAQVSQASQVGQITQVTQAAPTPTAAVAVASTGTTPATAPITATPTTQATVSAPVGSQTISAESAKLKCKNFLATLLKLANEQKVSVARNVRNLIQGLIDGKVEPENFTEELQKDLNSSPQPCLVPFLKKTLPYLRNSLARGELSIDGVKPPPISSVTSVPSSTTVIPSVPISRASAPSPAPTVTQTQSNVRMATPTTTGQPATTTTTTIHRPPITLGRIVPQHLRLQTSKTVVTTVRSQQSVGTATTNSSSTTTQQTTPTVTTTPATPVTTTNRVTTTQPKPIITKDKSKEKVFASYTSSTISSSSVADDDINDVAAMGGVNLGEESQRILDSTCFVGTQIRSCKDEHFLLQGPLQNRIKQMAAGYGLEEPPKDVTALISHATQERLKTLVEKLAVIAEHRLDIIKSEARYEVTQDVKGQLRFLEELDKLEKKRKDEQEREMLMRAAKSRSKTEDPEQAKLKAKAKELQRVEMEEMRQRDANMTALKALQSPKKRPKLDLSNMEDGSTFSGTFTHKQMPLRPRIKRVNLRDLLFIMEQEKETNKSTLLYKSYLK